MKSSAGGIQITPLDPASYRHMPWKNGGGVTIDIAVTMLPGLAPGSWEGIIWRFSRTAIVTPAPFSDLSGYDRELVLVSGEGLVLGTPVGEIDVRQAFRPVRFAGETSVVSRLEAGPVEVVNLIGARAKVRIALEVLKADGALSVEPGTHLAYAAHGAAALDVDGTPHRLAADHALRIEVSGPTILKGIGGVLLLGSVICV